MSERDEVSANIVLTFQDSDGNRWLAAGYLGDLVAEQGPYEHSALYMQMPLREMIDQAMMLVDFKVVQP